MSALTSRPNPAQSTAEDNIVYGAVHLDVTDRDRAVAFWAGLIGLQVLVSGADEIRLGVDGRELVVLHPGAIGPTPRGHSGLYHLALHLPSEAEFARVLLRIAQAEYPQSPTDHVMHWASYLWDPDGIGLELTFETLDRFSHFTLVDGHPMVVDSQGQLRSATGHLDLREVVSHLNGRDVSRPLPGETRLGHIHLHVADVDQSVRFYADTVGFIPNEREPLLGMADMRAGGSFPHRLAMNIWQGEGAPQRPAGTAGLRHFELLARGATPAPLDGTPRHDPAGNAFTLAHL